MIQKAGGKFDFGKKRLIFPYYTIVQALSRQFLKKLIAVANI
jgi:hypothetical protein